MQVIGTVSKIRFRNSENGWGVFVLSTEDGPITCTGTFFGLHEGDEAEVEGEILYHPKYGEQLVATSVKKIEPTTESQLVHYLSSGILPHIGERRAKRLVKEYGTDVIRTLLDEPELLEKIRGIGKKKAAEIHQALIAQEKARESLMFLQSLELGPKTIAEVLRVYGEAAREKIEEDPYRLVSEVDGIGFLTADGIARTLGIEADSLQRSKAALYYLMEKAAQMDGACFLLRAELEAGLTRLLGALPATLDEALFEATLEGRLVGDPETGRWYLRRLDEAEKLVAHRLVELMHAGAPPLALDAEELARDVGLVLDGEQREALELAARHGVVVVTGGPGTGKTTLTRAVLAMFDQNALEVKLAAPTGRAAKRLEQSTHREALTLHRLLGYRGGEGAENGPAMNADNQLDCDVVVVDEVSMVDLTLMAHLCDALPDHARLVLVGDADQLPSVGAGNVLRDLIASGEVPTVRLEHIYRQAEESSIVVNAHRVRNGMDPVANSPDGDFFFLPASSSQDAADLIEDLVERRLPGHYGLDPKRDIQVLTAMKKGPCGTVSLNERLQRSLNPPRPEKREMRIGEQLFREGDAVMQIKNDYDLPWSRYVGRGDGAGLDAGLDAGREDAESAGARDGAFAGDVVAGGAMALVPGFFPEEDVETGEGVYNGDFGVLRVIDTEEDMLEVEYEGRMAHYSPMQFREIAHAYAITIHKSQGSEFPCVVMAVVPGAPLLLTRNLLYTGMTRARKLCVLVGDPRTLHQMVVSGEMRRRNSSLDGRLREAVERRAGLM